MEVVIKYHEDRHTWNLTVTGNKNSVGVIGLLTKPTDRYVRSFIKGTHYFHSEYKG